MTPELITYSKDYTAKSIFLFSYDGMQQLHYNDNEFFKPEDYPFPQWIVAVFKIKLKENKL